LIKVQERAVEPQIYRVTSAVICTIRRAQTKETVNLILRREKEIDETERKRGAVMRDTILFYGGNKIFRLERGEIERRKYRRSSTDRHHIFARETDRKFTGCEAS
jgi:hypothetical protein